MTKGRQQAAVKHASRHRHGRSLAHRVVLLACALAWSCSTAAAPALAAPAGPRLAPDGSPLTTTNLSQPNGTAPVTSLSAAKQVGDMEEIVSVLVVPQPGVDPLVTAQPAFDAEGVAPTDEFVTGVAVWPQFSSAHANDATVVQSYNPAGDPTGGAGLAAIQAAERTWSSVDGSRFRYEFGGVTTRCPASFQQCPGGARLSGHNDVGWLDLGTSRVLGITITSFFIGSSPSAGDLVEADIVLNSNAAIHWSTDGSGFDVQSAMTHEAGHATGLGHSPNPAAMMFAFLTTGQIKRTLAVQDTTAIGFLYPLRPLTLVSQPNDHGIHRLGQIGAGPFVGSFQPGAVNDRGEAAFAAGVNTGGRGVFLATADGVVEIVRSGGTVDGLTLGSSSEGPPGFDRDGNVVFAFDVGPDATGGQGAALFIYERVDRTVHAVLRPGVTAAPGGGVFEGALAGRMHHSQTIAFTGVIDTPAGPDYGVFTLSADRQFASVAVPGQALLGGMAISPQVPSINQAGDIAFVAAVGDDVGFSTFVRRSASNSIQLVARSGAPAPGGGTLINVFGAKITGDGNVLFVANLTASSPGPLPIGLFLATHEQLIPIARPGDLMPDGAHLVTLAGSSSSWSFGGENQFAFAATVDSHIGLRGSDTAVYSWTGGELQTVIRSGNVIPGIGPIGPRFALMNNRGQVLLSSTPASFFFPGSLLLVDSRQE